MNTRVSYSPPLPSNTKKAKHANTHARTRHPRCLPRWITFETSPVWGSSLAGVLTLSNPTRVGRKGRSCKGWIYYAHQVSSSCSWEGEVGMHGGAARKQQRAGDGKVREEGGGDAPGGGKLRPLPSDRSAAAGTVSPGDSPVVNWVRGLVRISRSIACLRGLDNRGLQKKKEKDNFFRLCLAPPGQRPRCN